MFKTHIRKILGRDQVKAMWLNRVYGYIPNPGIEKMPSFTYTIYILTLCSVTMMKFSSFSYCCIFNFSKYSTNMVQDNKMRSDTVSLPLEYTNMDPCDKVCIR